ncbi:phage tail protein [Chitiniphilus eburneus]|uniref:phage tail protein n=1 Tax=Chitiniphilus eburneus TaxID=2571148 RepID=UPI0035CF27E6
MFAPESTPDPLAPLLRLAGISPAVTAPGPMMSLGMFVFQLRTLPYQQSQHQRGWRHASNSRVGQRPALQYVGPDSEKMGLSGVLYPGLTGGESQLAELASMADSGERYPLIDGTGAVLGLFVIESLQVTRSEFFSDGAARKIDFDLQLVRADDEAEA